ncbi:MAG: HD domain-containing protein [Algisphaera sp.]
MSDLNTALALAAQAHTGQFRRNGEPYILHPVRVMLAGSSLDHQIVGILHDTVEDCDVTLDDLRTAGFSERIITGVDAMTNREGEDYDAFVIRCKADPLAREVKLNDIADNLDLDALPDPQPKDFERFKKYRKARSFLQEKG